MLRTYFDGSKQADSRQYDVVTLAAVHGKASHWQQFQLHWESVVTGKHGFAYLHVSEAVSGCGIYNGEPEPKRHALLEDCVAMLPQHLAHALDSTREARTNGIFPHTTTVVLKDFIKARETRTDVSDTAEELMIRQATATSAVWAEVQGTESFEYYFDQGEPYRGFVCDMKNSKRARQDAPWLERIVLNEERDMRFCPALQLADLFAWCVSNADASKVYEWQQQLLAMYRFDQSINIDNIGEVITGSQETWDSWRLPARRRTR